MSDMGGLIWGLNIVGNVPTPAQQMNEENKYLIKADNLFGHLMFLPNWDFFVGD